MRGFLLVAVPLLLVLGAAAFWWLGVPPRFVALHLEVQPVEWGTEAPGDRTPDVGTPLALYANHRLLGPGAHVVDDALLLDVGVELARRDAVPATNRDLQTLLQDGFGLEGGFYSPYDAASLDGPPMPELDPLVDLADGRGFAYLVTLGWKHADGALDSFALLHVQHADDAPGRGLLLRARRQSNGAGAWLSGGSGGGVTRRDGDTLRADFGQSFTAALFRLPLVPGEPRMVDPEGFDRWWIERFPVGAALGK